MKNQHDETDGHDDDYDGLADAITDVIWGWITLVVAKVRTVVRKARRKRE